VGGPNRPPSWKILVSSQPIDRFWWNMACCCVSTLSAPIANKISLFQISKMAAAATLKIRKIAKSPQKKRPILTTFSTMMSLGLPDTKLSQSFWPKYSILHYWFNHSIKFVLNYETLFLFSPLLPFPPLSHTFSSSFLHSYPSISSPPFPLEVGPSLRLWCLGQLLVRAKRIFVAFLVINLCFWLPKWRLLTPRPVHLCKVRALSPSSYGSTGHALCPCHQ